METRAAELVWRVCMRHFATFSRCGVDKKHNAANEPVEHRVSTIGRFPAPPQRQSFAAKAIAAHAPRRTELAETRSETDRLLQVLRDNISVIEAKIADLQHATFVSNSEKVRQDLAQPSSPVQPDQELFEQGLAGVP